MKKASMTFSLAKVENQANKNLRYSTSDVDKVRKCKNRIVIIRYAIPSALLNKAKAAYSKGVSMNIQFRTIGKEIATWSYIPGSNAKGIATTCPIFEEWVLVNGEQWDVTSGDLIDGGLINLKDELDQCNAKSIGYCINFNPKFADTSLHMGVDSIHPSAIAAMDGAIWLSARNNDDSLPAQWSRAVQSIYPVKIGGTSKLLNVAMSHDPSGATNGRFHAYVYHHGGVSVESSLGCSIAISKPDTVKNAANSSKAAVDMIDTLYKLKCPIYDHATGWSRNQDDFLSTTINVWLTEANLMALSGQTSSYQAAGIGYTPKGARPDLELYMTGRGANSKNGKKEGGFKSLLTGTNIGYMIGSLVLGLITGYIAKWVKNKNQGDNEDVEHIDTREIVMQVDGLDGLVDMHKLSIVSSNSQMQQARSSSDNFNTMVTMNPGTQTRPGVNMGSSRWVVRNGWGDPQCYGNFIEVSASKVDSLGLMGVKIDPIRQAILTMKSLVNPDSQIKFVIKVLPGVVDAHNAMTTTQKQAVISYLTNKIDP